ncbi:hypothetical protein [Paracoccus denitrificans]|uniref:hypothetical protein n=1 Tax=Paracoccus denitrificans TaxID=266 RepID=UPI00131A374D|nr:hypothetical protein [Paracoccus denitrificans]
MALLACVVTGSAMARENTVRLFISGHSLTDRPLPDMVAAMADHDGLSIDWDRQHIGGSTIRQRTFGDDERRPGSGYVTGVNRDGDPVDVLAKLASPPPHDIFVVTEWHRVLDALTAHETIRHLRDFQIRAMGSSPDARTYFYAPWADVADLGKPDEWISYERSASPVWRCIAARAGDGTRPVDFIPASLALADLVAYLNSDRPDGFTGATPAEISAQLFTDHVHLSDLGVYFVALITYGTLFGADLSQAWMPAGLDPSQAGTLRGFAAGFMEKSRAGGPERTDCKTLPSGFISTYTSYMQTAYTNAEMGRLRASLKRLRDTLRLSWRFHGWGDNPLATQ